MTIPSKRPVLLDVETYNGNPALSSLAKRLMQWVNFTNDRDLFCTPSDPLIPPANATRATLTRVSGGSETKSFGTAWIPPPLGPQTQIKVWLYVIRASVNATADFKLTSRRTGRVQTISLAAGVGSEGWEAHVIDAEGGDVFSLSLTSTHADAVSVWGACAWWHQASIVGATVDAYSKLSLTAAATDAALSAYVLRWLARRANQFALERPRPAFAKWWGDWWGVGGAVLGRYRVLISPGVTSITVHMYLRVAADPGVTPKVNLTLDDGVSTYVTATGALAVSATYAWTGPFTVTVPVSTQARTMELRIHGDGAAAGEYRIASVCAWEDPALAASLLPGVETVPSNFAAMTDEAISSRHAIVGPGAAGVSTLLADMVWCWRNRGLRSLVNDCRWDDYLSMGTAAAGDPLVGVGTVGMNQDGKSVQAAYRVRITGGVATWRQGVLYMNDYGATGRAVRITDDVTDPFDAPRSSTLDAVRWSENPSPQAYIAGIQNFYAREYPPHDVASEWESRAVGFQFEELPLATTGGGTPR